MSSVARWAPVILLLTLAAATRLSGLGDVPPGIHHDEASNGYDGYCLLKTGADRWGVRWPILLEGFGRCDYRGAVYAYLTVPFHALLGAEDPVVATRLPAAMVGVATIGALYALAARTFDRSVAFWAALLLALSPWHVQLSRFGHEASLTPAMTVFALMLMAYAGWPMRPRETGAGDGALNPRLLAAAGAVFGLSLYMYASMRVFVPAFLLAAAVIYRREVRRALCATRDRRAVLAMLIAAVVVATPLVWLAATDWDKTMARAMQVSVFRNAASWPAAVVEFAVQYAAHFGPRWLAIRGDPYLIQSPRAYGQLNLATIPLFMVGVVSAVRHARGTPVCALLLAWLALHPLAAAASGGPHALRSGCGVPAFAWLAGLGAACVVAYFGTVSARRRVVVTGAVGVAVVVNAAANLRHYFVKWPRNPWVYALYQQDLCDALVAARDLVGGHDRIYVSDQRRRDGDTVWHSGEAYALVALLLPVLPADFQRWDKDVYYEQPTDGFHRVARFGPFFMTTRAALLDELFRRRPVESALIIARPGELLGHEPLRVIVDDRGRPRFELHSVNLPPA